MRTEASLLAGTDLRTDRVSTALDGEAFTALLDAMDADLRRDAGARALTDAYADAIAMQFGEGGLTLDRIACGLRLCVVRIVGPDDPAPWTAWSTLFDADAATPSYARIEHEAELGAGLRERRLVFTVDPSSAGLTISAY